MLAEAKDVTLKITGRLDAKEAGRLKKLGYKIDWSAKTVTGRLYGDQTSVLKLIESGTLQTATA